VPADDFDLLHHQAKECLLLVEVEGVDAGTCPLGEAVEPGAQLAGLGQFMAAGGERVPALGQVTAATVDAIARFGAAATKLRLSRSGARSRFLSDTVVTTFLPRTAPDSPWARMRRSTVQRAT
jgi:hypothetical protein